MDWLTDQQLLDAIAVGQVTPGPLFTSATFIGYLLGGVQGAVLATLGIFLPSFVFVAISNPFVPRLRRSPWFGGLLDGVNVASLALMAAVTLQVARASVVDWITALLAVAATVLLLRFKVNSTWLVLAGGLVRPPGSLVVGSHPGQIRSLWMSTPAERRNLDCRVTFGLSPSPPSSPTSRPR